MVMPILNWSGLRDIGEGLRETWDTRTGWPALEKAIYGSGTEGTRDGGQSMSLSALGQPQPAPLQAAPVGQVDRTPIGEPDPASKRVAQAHSVAGGGASSGGLPSVSDMTAYIAQAAQKRGIDPAVAIRVAKSEGLAPGVWQSNLGKNGRREPSYGPFQLLVGGGDTGYPAGMGNDFMQQTGLDPSDPANWQKTIDFALDGAAKNGWGAWYGAAKAGIGNRQGIGGGSPSQAQLESMAVGQSMPMGQGQPQMAPQQAMQGAGQPSGGSLLPDRDTMRQLFQNRQTRPFAIQLAQNAMKARQGDPMAQIELEKARLELEQMRNPRGESFTLGEGQTRFDGQGNVVARGASPQAKAQPMTPEQRVQWGIPETDARPYMMTPEGPKVIGGSGVTVNVGGESDADAELRKKLGGKEGEAWASYKEAGTVSAGTMQDMQLMDQLIKMAPQGPIQGRLAQAFPGVSNAGAAFESIAKRVAPTLRAPGSGATSDIEYDGMLRSLPSLSNRPEANAAISEMMKQKARINMARSDIITSYQNQEIDVKTARRELAKLNSQSIVTPQIEQLFDELGIDVRQPAGDDETPLPGDIVDNHRFKGGDPSDMRNWEKLQ